MQEEPHAPDNHSLPTLRADEPNDPTARPGMDLSQAAEVTEIIQFIEQAFEWQLMTYIAYPYFWADASRWEDLLSTTSTDPDYASFLRAGSARVVVPSRKGKPYQCLAMAFLATGKLWGSGPAPTADQDLYVSVAQEIQDTTGAPDDGEWMFSWEVRLPTTLIWLDPNAGAQLPITNTSPALTAPPPDKQLCKILPIPEPGKGATTQPLTAGVNLERST